MLFGGLAFLFTPFHYSEFRNKIGGPVPDITFFVGGS
jgi:hypothetical protein